MSAESRTLARESPIRSVYFEARITRISYTLGRSCDPLGGTAWGGPGCGLLLRGCVRANRIISTVLEFLILDSHLLVFALGVNDRFVPLWVVWLVAATAKLARRGGNGLKSGPLYICARYRALGPLYHEQDCRSSYFVIICHRRTTHSDRWYIVELLLKNREVHILNWKDK